MIFMKKMNFINIYITHKKIKIKKKNLFLKLLVEK